MAAQSDVSTASTAGARVTDAFVIFAVTVVSLAAGAWLLVHLGLRVWSGLSLALAIYASLLSCHLMFRRRMSQASAPTPAMPPDLEFDPWANDPAGAPPPALPTADDQRNIITKGSISATAAAPTLPEPRLDDPFAFRPAGPPALDPTPAPPPLMAAPKAPAMPPPLTPEQAANLPPEMSVEMVQDLIKKLADELNTAPANPPRVRGKLVPQVDEGEAMIGRSIAALEATAKSMRAAPAKPFGKAPPRPAAARPAPPPPPPPAPPEAVRPPEIAPQPVNAQLVRIAEAIAAERMEVLLEPIQALTEGRARHFEVSTRLLTADGAAIDQQEAIRLAQGSGLMPRIDIARILRAARVARRLGQGGRAGSVLTAAAGESLSDQRFIATATTESNTGTTKLVLSFPQSEVRNFSTGHAQTLTALAEAGFRFALDAVTDLDMDFGGLKRMGFEFVKLDAPVFLEGLPAPGGLVPAADICRLLAEDGLTLIVGRIEDDWLLARILGFGVLFGSGTLFGGPRLVKAEVVSGPSSAA